MSIREELVYYCHLVSEKGFVAAFDGNLSVRLPNGNILITPSATPKGEVKTSDLIEIGLKGNIIKGKKKLSTENKLHTFIYKNRKDVNAVIHCHPIYASILSITKRKINFAIFPEVVLTLGKIAVCRYATPSTEEVADSMLPFVKSAWVYILRNHGAVSSGVDLRDAFYKMEKLEHFSKIITQALQIGDINNLNDSQLKKLYSIAESTYNIKINPKNKYS
ncbi:MAG: class II aldolase/adducin family protein [Ignavibacteriales bacterium]